MPPIPLGGSAPGLPVPFEAVVALTEPRVRLPLSQPQRDRSRICSVAPVEPRGGPIREAVPRILFGQPLGHQTSFWTDRRRQRY